ncbi:MAG: NADH-quinone oxidoreductase subunit L [Cystobacterineae bacterium]|nr:NADH-quinone oxidoreductase subunit L [Cystobacterineae bacterium]
MEKLFPEYPFPIQNIESGLWLIIALPLLGAFINGVFGKALGRKNVHWVACASVGGSFLLSLLVMWALGKAQPEIPGPLAYALSADYGTWFAVGDFKVNFGLFADRLSATMLLVITGVGFLIHLYSTSYMEHDKGYAKYFSFLNLFVAMMLTLVLADSLVLLFVGWEGVGLCSYLLIGFWYDDEAKAWAGRKAFITNRIGDFGFLVASFLLVLLMAASVKEAPRGTPVSNPRFSASLAEKGPLAFQSLSTLASTLATPDISAAKLKAAKPDHKPALLMERDIQTGPLKGFSYSGVLTVVLLFFLLGAAGKSAQLPLYVWLPDAMAGPTPVSALIHAATMVTAGVYLFCRISYLVVLSPFAMATIAVVGCLTALIAALIAFAQDDIKKILAYSTVSQLGFMFMGIGCGLFWAAFLHVVTHAFFKACMFLGAGSVMHGNGDETDIKRLGGLRKEMPWTSWTFLIGTLAITGIVPLSGFFSKDAILFGLETQQLAGYTPVLHTLYILGLIAAACTAFYMVRLYVLTFEGKRSPLAKLPHAHESAWPMTLPLVILATLSIAAIVYGVPFLSVPNAPNQTLIEFYLAPVFNASNQANQLGMKAHMLLPGEFGGETPWNLLWTGWIKAWLIAVVCGGISCFLYLKVWRGGRKFPAILEPLRRFAHNKFFVDELYELLLINRTKGLAKGLYRYVDAFFVDRVAVHGTAQTVGFFGRVLRWFQNGNVQAYASAIALALAVGLTYALLQVLS